MSYLKYFLDLLFGRAIPKPKIDHEEKNGQEKIVVPDPTPIPPKPKDEDTKKPVTIAEKLLISHNGYRSKNGKAALQLNDKLCEAALKHAAYMESVNVLTHIGRRGDRPWDRTLAEGYENRTIGENIAVGDISIDSVMNMWINSSGHRQNILGEYKCFGAAKMGNYWCVVFGG